MWNKAVPPCPIEVKSKEYKRSFMSFERIGAFFCFVLVAENKNLNEKGSERKWISVADSEMGIRCTLQS
jgi:hypothetical protein